MPTTRRNGNESDDDSDVGEPVPSQSSRPRLTVYSCRSTEPVGPLPRYTPTERKLLHRFGRAQHGDQHEEDEDCSFKTEEGWKQHRAEQKAEYRACRKVERQQGTWTKDRQGTRSITRKNEGRGHLPAMSAAVQRGNLRQIFLSRHTQVVSFSPALLAARSESPIILVCLSSAMFRIAVAGLTPQGP